MARTLLEHIQRVSMRIGLPIPSAIITSTDAQVKQLRVCLEDAVAEAMARWTWEVLQRRATFTSVAAESQGTLVSLTGTDFVKINNDTIWDLTNRRPIRGPVSQSHWQERTAAGLTGPFYEYQIRGGELLLNPAPSAGDSYSFFWTSNKCYKDAGGTAKSALSADDDTVVFSDAMVYYGTLYLWKMEKGLPYAEDLRQWELVATSEALASGTKPTLYLDEPARSARPGIVIPEGSWPL